MACKYFFIIWATILPFYYIFVEGRGLMLLYRPKDITVDCASSDSLRYDLSFGMGMSDTITVILRTLPDVDYECLVDITTDRVNKLIAVIRFPNTIGYSCEHNPSAFHLMKYDNCFPVCDEEELEFQDIFSHYLIIFTQGRFRFQFRSNSSINLDIGAYLYEVTVTTARLRDKDHKSCYSAVNETECYSPTSGEYYCMTSGVICDGIKNCGTEDWYDERLSDCEVPIQTLGYPPILAVVSFMMCALVALAHLLKRCLPRATSFFIFITNEDNRFCLDPVFNQTESGTYEVSESFTRKKSLIPTNWTDSDEESTSEDEAHVDDLQKAPLAMSSRENIREVPDQEKNKESRQSQNSQMRKSAPTMTQRISNRLRSMVGNYLSSGSTGFANEETRHQKSNKQVKTPSRY